MATYTQIQEYIKNKYRLSVKTCWIAHSKEILGLNNRVANNRIDPNKRVYPCPEDKKEMIAEAFKHFDMI